MEKPIGGALSEIGLWKKGLYKKAYKKAYGKAGPSLRGPRRAAPPPGPSDGRPRGPRSWCGAGPGAGPADRLFHKPFYILNIRYHIINRLFYTISTQY